MIPEQIGRYRILTPLGKGAIGEVFKALDPDLGREVAIKVITQSGADGVVQERFRREVQLAAHLTHPNIITVYDVGLDHQPPFLVTELLGEGTLRAYLERGASPWDEALTLLQPICEALGYAHEAGIVHRDVKPSNIMFADDKSQTIKLADFGLAQRLEDDRLTESGGIVGTIAYMSPEQANGEAIDARTDIFSLGLILLESISGNNPLRGDTVSQTLRNAISNEPVDLSQVAKDVPGRVLDLLSGALARERRDRYRSCRQLSQDIALCLSSKERLAAVVPTSTPGVPAAASEHVPAVQIENARGLSLPPNAREILQGMFADYRRVSISEELAGGFSGSRVFVVRPVRKDHIPELPAVIKMAPLRLIDQEWHAYQAHIRDQLSGVTQFTGEPVFPSGSSWGGLRYRLVGSGAIEFDSLSQFYHQATADDLRFILEERLFKRLASLWRFNFPTSAFHLAASYDHLLPVNLTIRYGETESDATIPVIRAGEVGVPKLVQGDPVRLSGFVVSEVEPADEVITLDWPSAEERSPGTYRIRLQPLSALEGVQVDLVIDSIDGVVMTTRQDLMRASVLEVLGRGFDVEAKSLLLPGGRELPNPFVRLPSLLTATPNVRLANIHGDLNPENILVDSATRDVRLIDFATARRDHVLHDFLRLETGIVTRLLPETLKAAGMNAEAIFHLYEQVHCATFTRSGRSSVELGNAALEKPFVMLDTLRNAALTYLFDPAEWGEYYQGLALYLMGALKYKNLDKAAKKIALYGAAAALRFIDEPPPCHEEQGSFSSEKAIWVPPAVDALDSAPISGAEEIAGDPEKPAKATAQKKSGWAKGFPLWLRNNWLPTLLVAALITVIAVAIVGNIVESGDGSAPATRASSTDLPAQILPTDTRRPTAASTRPVVNALSPTPRPIETLPFGDISGQDLTVAILLDTSSSMNDQGKLTNALVGIRAILEELDSDDEVIVYVYGGELLKLEPSGRAADVRDDLIKVVSGLFADGPTHLFDALCLAAEELETRYLDTGGGDEQRSYGLIVLTDGKDSGEGSITSEDDVFDCLDAAGEQVELAIRALAYGDEADVDFLERLVRRGDGQLLQVFPENILERLSSLTFDP